MICYQKSWWYIIKNLEFGSCFLLVLDIIMGVPCVSRRAYHSFWQGSFVVSMMFFSIGQLFRCSGHEERASSDPGFFVLHFVLRILKYQGSHSRLSVWSRVSETNGHDQRGVAIRPSTNKIKLDFLCVIFKTNVLLFEAVLFWSRLNCLNHCFPIDPTKSRVSVHLMSWCFLFDAMC